LLDWYALFWTLGGGGDDLPLRGDGELAVRSASFLRIEWRSVRRFS